MKITIRNSNDFVAGLIFIFFGTIVLVVSRDYSMGTAVRMGPGYFPSILGGILLLLGITISIGGLGGVKEPLKSWGFRPIIFILGSVLAFAYLLEHIGLVLTNFALICLSSFAGKEFRLREVIILYALLTLIAVAVFSYGLGMPLNLWPE